MSVISTKPISTLRAATKEVADGAVKAAGADGGVGTQAGVCIGVTLVLQAILCGAVALFVLRRDWENVFLTGLVILLTLAPAIARRGYRVHIPPEFQLVSAAFVFISLFLGSALDLYYEYWWWDLVLHAASGFLLGIAGFIAVFALNRRDSLPRGMRPAFVCIFGVAFAVTLGVAWEIFEYVMDVAYPWVNMQSRETGVADTMEDLILNTLGAAATGFAGWLYLRKGRESYIIDGVRALVRRNPMVFRPRRGRVRRAA